MDFEERISGLEKVVLDQQAELIAMDILLRALIASSPKAADLQTALAMLSTNFSEQMREHGFSTGRAPKTANAAESAVLSHVARWHKLFPANPEGFRGESS